MTVLLLVSSVFYPLLLGIFGGYAALLFIDATWRERGDWRVGILAIPAAFTQLLGYGLGFWHKLPRLWTRDKK